MSQEKKKTGLIVGIIIAVVVAIAAVVTAVVINLNKGSNVVGKYHLSATIDSEGAESTTTADFMKAFGVDYTIEFKADKTGELIVTSSLSDDGNESTVTSFTYDDKKINATNDYGQFESEYTYKDDSVTLKIGDETMKFTRDSK